MSYWIPHCPVIPELVIRSRILTEAIFGDGGRSLWEISQRIQEGSVISKALWSNTAFNLY